MDILHLERSVEAMRFYVYARGSGKNVRVVDRVQGREVFNDYLDANAQSPVVVGSPDGLRGNVDIWERMRAENAEFEVQLDYNVAQDEIVEIDDV